MGATMKMVYTMVIALVLLAMPSVLSAQTKFDTRTVKMTVSGTSTLHDWDVPAKKVSVKGELQVNGSTLQAVNSMMVEAEAKSLKSEKGESMDEKIYEALDADNNPKISFQLTKVKSIDADGNEFTINATGNMTIAGVKQVVDMVVKGKVLANGDVQFTGSKKMKLSTFKIERPSAMMGVVKCGEEITVSFDVVMKKL